MPTVQEIVQRDKTEEELIAWLEAKSPEEFRQILASSWVASLFSPETIEELYQEIQQQEAPSLEVGLD
jgi:hypothetical protein